MYCIVQEDIVYNLELLPLSAYVQAVLTNLFRYTSKKRKEMKWKQLHILIFKNDKRISFSTLPSP